MAVPKEFVARAKAHADLVAIGWEAREAYNVLWPEFSKTKTGREIATDIAGLNRKVFYKTELNRIRAIVNLTEKQKKAVIKSDEPAVTDLATGETSVEPILRKGMPKSVREKADIERELNEIVSMTTDSKLRAEVLLKLADLKGVKGKDTEDVEEKLIHYYLPVEYPQHGCAECVWSKSRVWDKSAMPNKISRAWQQFWAKYNEENPQETPAAKK